MGPSLQASPRPKALPPARRLDSAAHSVAAIQAVAERWLATAAGNQAVRRVRAGELDSVDREVAASMRNHKTPQNNCHSGSDINRLNKILPVIPRHPIPRRLGQFAGMPQ